MEKKVYVDNYRGVHDRALRNGKKCQNNKKLKSNNKITRRRRNLDLFFFCASEKSFGL
jgi:hypothetical protein